MNSELEITASQPSDPFAESIPVRMGDGPENVIRIDRLSYRYAGMAEPALDEVSLTIERGSFFGLLGPNGAGKTTLLSLMTGVLPLQCGEVSLFGRLLSRERNAALALTGLVPQDYAFYPRLTGRENLQFFAGIHGLSGARGAERIDRAVAICGIGDYLGVQAGSYSGGMKRRLNLAIGLLNDPQVLYLDEPTVGIDAQSRRCVLDAIKALNADGRTVIYTSHYMEEVEQLCGTVAIIDHGRLLVHERMGNLLRQRWQEEARISLSRPLSPEELGHPLLAALKQDELQLYGPVGVEAISPLLRHLREIGAPPRRALYGAHPLEQVYLRLIGETPPP